MAWASKKQYAILNASDKGKALARQLAGMGQDEFQRRFNELLKEGGSSSGDKSESKTLEAKKELLKNRGKADEKETKEGTPQEKAGDEQKAGKEGEYERYKEFCEKTNRKAASKEAFDGVKAFLGR